jgi:hypothetical protein
MRQKCAYCDWLVWINPAGYLRLHYRRAEVCLGTGFVASQMSRLVGRIAKTKLEALDVAGCQKERRKKACS